MKGEEVAEGHERKPKKFGGVPMKRGVVGLVADTCTQKGNIRGNICGSARAFIRLICR
jgi:hypothetical protein